MATEPLPTLLLLNHLGGAGYLSSGLSNVQGGRWRPALVKALQERLVRFASRFVDSIDRLELAYTLRLIPTLRLNASEVGPCLAALIRSFGHLRDFKGDELLGQWREGSVWNDAHLLSLVLDCADSYQTEPDVRTVLTGLLVDEQGVAAIIRNWHWNTEVMSRLASLSNRADWDIA